MAKAREYELVLVLSPALDEERTSTTVGRVHDLITNNGGSLVKHEAWGLRRLAYPIQRFNEGNYFLTQFSADPTITRQLEGALRISEDVLRHLMTRVEG